MQFRVEYDKRPPIRAMVMEDEIAMRQQLDIYRDPNTRFRVVLKGGKCVLPPLALAVEIADFDFAKVLSVLVNGDGQEQEIPPEGRRGGPGPGCQPG